jgi:hypothetical protein
MDFVIGHGDPLAPPDHPRLGTAPGAVGAARQGHHDMRALGQRPLSARAPGIAPLPAPAHAAQCGAAGRGGLGQANQCTLHLLPAQGAG